MTSRLSLCQCLIAAIFSAMAGGCATANYQAAVAPIEVIESNYIESTNDAEIVYDLPKLQLYAACEPIPAS
jgi:hypothetical protein